MGDTWVLCSAAVEEQVPGFLVGKGQGWVTSEYAMIPPSSPQRIPWNRGTGGGRQQEISRLIGRGLRAAIDLKQLGERQIMLDCTVIQADGGTRTAGVTGAYVALALAVHDLLAAGKLTHSPLITPVAAVSVGLVKGEALLDLAYVEDSVADADVNVIQTSSGDLVEVQGTAEGVAFPARKTGSAAGPGEPWEHRSSSAPNARRSARCCRPRRWPRCILIRPSPSVGTDGDRAPRRTRSSLLECASLR